MKAGFIGTGSMGCPLADNILRQEGSLAVYDIDPEAARPLTEKQARLMASPQAVAAESDVVFACLPSTDSFHAVATGADGVIEGGRAKLFVNLGTMGSTAVRAVAERLAEAGIETLDCPITGGTPRAWKGDVTAIASGPRAVFDRVRPLIEAFASKVVYVGGEIGQSQTLKLINNMLSCANLALACEGLVMGAKAGLDPETVLEVINAGSGQNSATSVKIPNHVLSRKFDYNAPMRITRKDLDLWQAEAESLAVPQWVGNAVRQLYMHSMATGSESGDLTEIVKDIENWAGVEVPKTR